MAKPTHFYTYCCPEVITAICDYAKDHGLLESGVCPRETPSKQAHGDLSLSLQLPPEYSASIRLSLHPN